MKIKLLAVGEYNNRPIKDLCQDYITRIIRYSPFEIDIISNKKKHPIKKTTEIKKYDSELIIHKLMPSDFVILLDEKGNLLKSISFSEQLNIWLYRSNKRIVFVLGGAHGFSDQLYQRSDYILSLSKLTFSHQIARLVFLEQLYRAFTIFKNEPYHHE